MSFRQIERVNPDFVEASFREAKAQYPECLEFDLIPTIVTDVQVSVPPISDNPLTAEERELALRLAPWGYSIDLDSEVNTKQLDQERLGIDFGSTGKHETAIRMSILDLAMKAFAPSGRWLDIATNNGSIPLILSKGKNYTVEANDINAVNIEKAQFLQKLSGREDCKFFVSDAFDHLRFAEDESYDVISALGLFYHLSDPLGLASLMYQKTKKVAIIETIVHNFPFSGWIQTVSRHVKFEELRHANDSRKIFELHPTYRGMIDTLFQVGFSAVYEVLPSEQTLAANPGTVFSTRNRRLFIGMK